MMKTLISIATLLLLASAANAQDAEPVETEAEDASVEAAETETAAAADEGPKTMSGMSILGNEEAPKSLVIIPWKSSELGEDISLTNTLDDRAQPVDKEVFLRELSFYRIRAGE